MVQVGVLESCGQAVVPGSSERLGTSVRAHIDTFISPLTPAPRYLQLFIIVLALVLLCLLQAVRVLKSYGMSSHEIKGMLLSWVRRGGKDEL